MLLRLSFGATPTRITRRAVMRRGPRAQPPTPPTTSARSNDVDGAHKAAVQNPGPLPRPRLGGLRRYRYAWADWMFSRWTRLADSNREVSGSSRNQRDLASIPRASRRRRDMVAEIRGEEPPPPVRRRLQPARGSLSRPALTEHHGVGRQVPYPAPGGGVIPIGLGLRGITAQSARAQGVEFGRRVDRIRCSAICSHLCQPRLP